LILQDEQSGFNYNERTNPRRRRLSFIISLFQSVACRQARASQYGSRCAAIRVLRTLLRRRKNRSRRSRLAVYTAVAQDPLDTSERKVDNLLRRATESNPWLHDSSGPALPRRCRITRSERERALRLCGTQRGGCPLWCRGEDESRNARKQCIRQTKCEILSPFSGYRKKVLIWVGKRPLT